MSFTDDGIAFPVVNAVSGGNHIRTLVNKGSARQQTPTVITVIALSTLFLTSQVSVKCASRTFIFVDMLINPLRTDENMLFRC